jgi:FAD binding domain
MGRLPMWTNENRAKYNRDHLRYPSDLTDDEWALVEPFIPPPKPGGGKRTVNMRAVISTRHIEIVLPSGVSYSAGDHLGIVPRNGLETIKRVLMRFKLDPSLYATIVPSANADTHLPVNEPVPLLGILANRIELREVATREQIATLARHVKDETERKALEALAGDDARYGKQVFAVRKSVLDIVDEHPSCAPPFEVFLDMMHIIRSLHRRWSPPAYAVSRSRSWRALRSAGAASSVGSARTFSPRSRPTPRCTPSSASRRFRFIRPRTRTCR